MTSFIGNIITAIKNIVRGPMSKYEVDNALTSLSQHRPEQLAWRTSVVDLLKLLDLDTSIAARETLAGELGFPGHFTGSANDNTTLHRLIMEDVAKHYTKIPTA